MGLAIKELRQRRGLTVRELASKVNLSFSRVAAIERSGNLHPSKLDVFATALGVSSEQLERETLRLTAAAKLGIPLINVTPAGNVLDYTEWGTTSKDAPSYIDRDSDTQSDRLFALKIVGNSMSPTIEEGDICVFRSIDQENDEPPSPGSIVYVHLGNDAKHVGGCCGRFYPLDASTYRIRKDNPAHKSFDVNAEHVDQLAVCIQRRTVPR